MNKIMDELYVEINGKYEKINSENFTVYKKVGEIYLPEYTLSDFLPEGVWIITKSDYFESRYNVKKSKEAFSLDWINIRYPDLSELGGLYKAREYIIEKLHEDQNKTENMSMYEFVGYILGRVYEYCKNNGKV